MRTDKVYNMETSTALEVVVERCLQIIDDFSVVLLCALLRALAHIALTADLMVLLALHTSLMKALVLSDVFSVVGYSADHASLVAFAYTSVKMAAKTFGVTKYFVAPVALA